MVVALTAFTLPENRGPFPLLLHPPLGSFVKKVTELAYLRYGYELA